MLITVLFSCRKQTNYPTVPAITYKSFVTYYPDSAILTINCKDGEGDIGLKPSDTLAPYGKDSKNYYDLFLEYYEYVGGVKKHIELNPPFYYRIKYIPRPGKIKGLNADISVNLSPYYYDPFSTADTFAYSIQLEDRALHESNIVFTPPMVKGQ